MTDRNDEENRARETGPDGGSCAAAAMAQVDSPADLQNGIVEIVDKDEYIDEP